MTIDEIIQVVKANVDKVIVLKYKSDEVDMVLVQTVDDEGFVFDLVSLKPEDTTSARKVPAMRTPLTTAGPPYWTPFSEIAEVQP